MEVGKERRGERGEGTVATDHRPPTTDHRPPTTDHRPLLLPCFPPRHEPDGGFDLGVRPLRRAVGRGGLDPGGQIGDEGDRQVRSHRACGRAALRDLRVRGLLYTTTWSPGTAYQLNALVIPRTPNGNTYICTTPGTSSTTTEPTWPTTVGSAPVPDGSAAWADMGTVFVIDPRGSFASLPPTFGGSNLRRGGLATLTTAAQADAVFRSQDDLIFSRPEEMVKTATFTPPPAGTRPIVPPGTRRSEGNASWFLTVAPDPLQPTLFSVSVVTCYGRTLLSSSERLAPPSGTVTCASPSYGGTIVTYNGTYNGGDIISVKPPIKADSWVLLYSATQASWYRVVHAGYDVTSNTSSITLVGPDWYGGTTGNIVVVDGVTGVYTETVQLN